MTGAQSTVSLSDEVTRRGITVNVFKRNVAVHFNSTYCTNYYVTSVLYNSVFCTLVIRFIIRLCIYNKNTMEKLRNGCVMRLC